MPMLPVRVRSPITSKLASKIEFRVTDKPPPTKVSPIRLEIPATWRVG